MRQRRTGPGLPRATVCCLLALVLASSAVAVRAGAARGTPDDGRGAPPSSPAGVAQAQAPVPAEACASCHKSAHDAWLGARHSKMLQPATAVTVLGRFSDGAVTLRGAQFTLARDGDAFVVTGPFPGPQPATYQVAFTLGSRRVQHYLARLADGRIVVLPPSWDVEKQEWFHNLDIVSPDVALRQPVQVWNRSCVGCHVSAQDKAYDAVADRYQTTWLDFGTSCERCHGPGADHVAKYTDPSSAASKGAGTAILVPSRLSADKSTAVCGQCHSLRDLTVPGFRAGGDYFDHFTPVLEYAQDPQRDPPYWADGRPRRFSNDAIGLWQSRCYLDGGATCTTCHRDPHEPNIERHPELAPASSATCAPCHAPLSENLPAHSRHAAGPNAPSCINCHMPRTVVSLRSTMPDHTMSVPAPENTAAHGIPNACNACHRDRDPAWAAARLAEWFPGGRRRALVARADAFAAGRAGRPDAVSRLRAIADDDAQPPLIRANAVGYLRRVPGPDAQAALVSAALSRHPAIRAAAMLGLGERPEARAEAVPVLTAALADARRVVRVGAALALLNHQVTALDGQAGQLFEGAKRDYTLRAAWLSDDPGAQLDAGKFHLLSRRPDEAADAIARSLRLDAALPSARYYLALARLAQGQLADARDLLRLVPAADPMRAAALQLLLKLPAGGR
jgi:hypothetical protein